MRIEVCFAGIVWNKCLLALATKHHGDICEYQENIKTLFDNNHRFSSGLLNNYSPRQRCLFRQQQEGEWLNLYCVVATWAPYACFIILHICKEVALCCFHFDGSLWSSRCFCTDKLDGIESNLMHGGFPQIYTFVVSSLLSTPFWQSKHLLAAITAIPKTFSKSALESLSRGRL